MGSVMRRNGQACSMPFELRIAVIASGIGYQDENVSAAIDVLEKLPVSSIENRGFA